MRTVGPVEPADFWEDATGRVAYLGGEALAYLHQGTLEARRPRPCGSLHGSTGGQAIRRALDSFTAEEGLGLARQLRLRVGEVGTRVRTYGCQLVDHPPPPVCPHCGKAEDSENHIFWEEWGGIGRNGRPPETCGPPSGSARMLGCSDSKPESKVCPEFGFGSNETWARSAFNRYGFTAYGTRSDLGPKLGLRPRSRPAKSQAARA